MNEKQQNNINATVGNLPWLVLAAIIIRFLEGLISADGILTTQINKYVVLLVLTLPYAAMLILYWRKKMTRKNFNVLAALGFVPDTVECFFWFFGYTSSILVPFSGGILLYATRAQHEMGEQEKENDIKDGKRDVAIAVCAVAVATLMAYCYPDMEKAEFIYGIIGKFLAVLMLVTCMAIGMRRYWYWMSRVGIGLLVLLSGYHATWTQGGLQEVLEYLIYMMVAVPFLTTFVDGYGAAMFAVMVWVYAFRKQASTYSGNKTKS